jgi:hypothetical protein
MSAETFHHRGPYGSLNGSRPLTHNGDDNTESLHLGSLDSTKKLQQSDDPGSGWVGAAFNLTSSIVGAGCIGLGGAIANSGGLVSLVAISVFAVLSKYSFDLVVDLALESSQDGAHQTTTYESLGFVTYGNAGKMTVIVSKGLYSLGCLVAYIKIVKDNFAFALAHLLYGYDDTGDAHVGPAAGAVENILTNQYFVTIFFCTSVMLPLSMLRDVTPLERFSALKITVVLLIVFIVMCLFVVSDHQEESDFVNHWLVIHHGVFERSVPKSCRNGICCCSRSNKSFLLTVLSFYHTTADFQFGHLCLYVCRPTRHPLGISIAKKERTTKFLKNDHIGNHYEYNDFGMHGILCLHDVLGRNLQCHVLSIPSFQGSGHVSDFALHINVVDISFSISNG